MRNINKNIRDLRQATGLSQQQFADKVHVTQQAVNRWETGRSYPQSDRIQEIAHVFDKPIEAVMLENGNDLAFTIPIDRTQELKENIERLRAKCSSPDCTYKDKVDLIFSEALLESNSETSGGSGQYIIHVMLNEYEYNLWKAIRNYCPDYSLNDFLTLKDRAWCYKYRQGQ